MATSTAAERRRTARAPIELWVHELSDDRAVLHPAANLSSGGLFLYADRLRAAEVHRLEFTLPDDVRTIRVQARAAWTSRAEGVRGFGLEFVDLTADDEVAISAYVVKALGGTLL